MYFVDREKIETILQFLERKFSLFEEIKEWDSLVGKAALERTCHIIIEVVLDVGNAMIDGFIMRDPGSYEDIIDILEDEKVIDASLSSSCKEIIKYRKMLVQMYTEIEHAEVHEVFSKNLFIVMQFPEKVRAYLLNELGPVTAFRN